MDVNQQAELAKLRQAQNFLDSHADVLESINRAPARAELDTRVRSIAGHAADQDQATVQSGGLTKVKNEMHRRVRHELGRIGTLARARPAKFGTLQDVSALSRHASDLTVLSTAIGIANGAEQYRAEFESEGFGRDFVDRFRMVIAEFEHACRECMLNGLTRVRATRGIKEDLSVAWTAIAVIGALFESDGVAEARLLSEWRTETIHAARRLLKTKKAAQLAAPAEVRLLAAPAGDSHPPSPMPALSAGDAPAPSTAMVVVSQEPTPPAPTGRRGLFRLVVRLLGREWAA